MENLNDTFECHLQSKEKTVMTRSKTISGTLLTSIKSV
ncbi:hypothetical protein Hlac_3341 (plasmid) [Halorubrum lacusprofundi ATCC 49239]|uniref:Uncharacterized protein n=1 Tax=Halorubrum lacusprofundi (strain ATCC 49239 / DSM 5036 / JCM 8891 / ACAM 34) TaxID=416348 RepID=B9LWM1_HALLT|nr:hypothetical protein Hlac_3341 [Halorubrum lacusprofundi ATCC 49239]